MNEWIDWFQRVLDVSIRLYFRQECDLSSVYDIPLPKAGPLWKALLPEQVDPTFDEWMVLMLAAQERFTIPGSFQANDVIHMEPMLLTK